MNVPPQLRGPALESFSGFEFFSGSPIGAVHGQGGIYLGVDMEIHTKDGLI